MTISQDKFVAIHYTLKDTDGNILDTSTNAEPLAYIQGNNMLIPGLEKQLEGKAAGDKFTAVVQPEDAYGTYDERLIANVPKDRFEEGYPIEVGMQFAVTTPAGPTIVKVIEVSENSIKVDGNHALAGKVLNFDIEVIEVRDASDEDKAQFMAGGCGGGCSGNCGGGCGGDCGGDCGGECGGDCNCSEGGCGGEGCNCGK